MILGTSSLFPLKAQFYYGLNQEFGKNRVQYVDFDWFLHRFERYDIYFYRGNDELAAQVARLTDKTLVRIENFLDAPLEDRVQILVFNNLSDLKQSNVNSNEDEDYNSTGVTRISGRRLFLYFNGSYADLEKDLRSGLAEVVLSNLVYGGFTQSLKNSTLLNLPEWYTEGLISYIGDDWNSEIDSKIKDGFLSGKYKRINSLIGEDAKNAGHSFWHYIAQTYGRKVLKNIIYMAIVNRNIESGFSYILGKDLEMITKGWKDFYKEQYKDGIFEDELKGDPIVKVPKSKRIARISLSKDGTKLAYVKQKFGEYKVYIKDLETGKKKRILKGGHKIAQNADYSFPLLAWHPNGEILAMFTEEKGFIYLNFYNLSEKKLEKKRFFKFDEILSFKYSQDGKRFLMSAVKRNQSDIFIYTILNTKIEQLTNDSYDDRDPSFFDNEKRVAFSSNRISDTLKKKEWSTDFPKQSLDIFAMKAQEPTEDTSVIWRLTNSDGISEYATQEFQDGYLSFLSGRSGIVNRHLIKIDSSIAYVDTITHYEYSFKEYQQTNYNRSIQDYSIGKEGEKDYVLILRDRRYKVYGLEHKNAKNLTAREIQPMPKSANKLPLDSAKASSQSTQTELISSNDVSPLYYPGHDPNSFEINISDYEFDDESRLSRRSRRRKPVVKKVEILPSPETVQVVQKEEELEIPPKRNYFLSFFKDDFSIGFDNIFSNPQYQRFTGFVTPDLLNFGFNSNFKVGVIDLMHDYRIIGAANTNFQPLSGTSIVPNAEFYISVSNYKKRLDIDYVFSRRSQVLIQNFSNYDRIITYELMPKFSWPFNPVSSIRGSVGYRLDKTIVLTRESFSLEEDDAFRDYAVAKLAFVHDNTRKIGLNLYSGLRYKLFTEYYRNLNQSPTGLFTAGIDARHYTIIHRNLIWANRFASGISWGPERLIYIMGGVDNSFSNSVEPTPIADNNYVFQTLVTNMRGSFQNIRNGDKFAVINSELRWPILSYLFRRPIRSDIFKNLQVVGFADVGTAWNGPSPYSDENKINTTEIPFGSSGLIVLDSQKEPILAGIGTGLRTRVFGYFVRFDWAWGIEDGLMKPRIFSFSLGTDF